MWPSIFGKLLIHRARFPVGPTVDFTGSPKNMSGYEWQIKTMHISLTGQAITYVHQVATLCDEIKKFDNAEVLIRYAVH